MRPTCRRINPAVVSPFTLLAVALACASDGDPLMPEPVAGNGAVYVLRSVDGEPLPTVWVSNESVAITVRADTIRLRDGNMGDRVVVQEYQEAPPFSAGGAA